MENWKIKKINLTKNSAIPNVVKSIKWEITKELNGEVATYLGTTVLPLPSAENFVDLEEITSDTLKTWLDNVHPKSLKKIINGKLDKELSERTDGINWTSK